MRSGAGLGGPGRVLGGFSAGVGLLLGILVSSGKLLGGPGRLLVGSWEALGPSWATLRRLFDCLGRLLGCFGALLGAKLEPSWSPRGATSTPRQPKIEAKTVHDGISM